MKNKFQIQILQITEVTEGDVKIILRHLLLYSELNVHFIYNKDFCCMADAVAFIIPFFFLRTTLQGGRYCTEITCRLCHHPASALQVSLSKPNM